ncbi:hypothetical protein [Brevundimonas sp. GCM10030266]|uniref:hypothetical protein n=1 Tax=Brevundimonas sp. GCM10030266 TaxID=3273386 RepID=UPI003609DE9C
MLTLFVLATLALPQISAEDAARPQVSICTAQAGPLNRYVGVRRPDGEIWWHATPSPGGAAFSVPDEVTAGQRDWYLDRRPLTVRGLTYQFQGVEPLSDWPFRRYNRVINPIDGVPALVPLGAEDREVWVLLEPVGCRFAVWSREPAG